MVAWGVLITATAECVSVALFYGFNNYKGDIFVMIGHNVAYSKVFYVFGACWAFLCPAIFIV
jgi:hypothetical protein